MAGSVGVRGSVTIGAGEVVKVKAVDWQKGQERRRHRLHHLLAGADSRPKGLAEVVINEVGAVVQVRTKNRNTAKLGAPVAEGTRVLAYARGKASAGALATVAAKAVLQVRQATNRGSTDSSTASVVARRCVEAGVAAPLGCAVYSASDAARPRTIVGWTARGEWRSLTVPGSKFIGDGLRVGRIRTVQRGCHRQESGI